MPNQNYEIRGIDESLNDYASIAAEGLLASDPTTWKLYVDRVGQENLRGIYDAGRLIGGLAFYRMGQWFGGNRLDCAGYSAVAVSAAERGRGACNALLRHMLRENYAEGFPIASLYASTQYLYRTVGFEHAGTQTQYSLPMSSIGEGDRRLPAHRFTRPPFETLEIVAEQRARQSNGNISRSNGLWERLIVPYDCKSTTTYVLGDLDRPEGFAIFRGGRRDGGVPQSLVSTDVAVNTPAALNRLMALVRDHRSMCNRFEWYGAPNDIIHFMAAEQFVRVNDCVRWLLRIVNVPKALCERGYPSWVNQHLHLQIEDSVLPENEGRWLVEIQKGSASVREGGDGTLRMNVRGLAPLFSGLFTATQLAQFSVIESEDDAALHAADQIFAGPPPWMPEMF